LGCHEGEDDDDDDDIGVIETLDGTEVTETTRQFLRSWQANKEAVKQRLENGSGVNGRQASTAGSYSGSVCEHLMICHSWHF